MYEKHFGFVEEPFGVSPDPKFLYCSPQHAEAAAALHYGLAERRGFLVLVARAGMGKTTLLHHLLERWKDRADSAFLFRPPETREEMIAAVLEDLGVAPATDYSENCRRLHARAVECRRRGRRLLLVFDEAQGIPAAVLEEIRLLSNVEGPEEKLIEIILAAQPTLAQRLAGPESEQLRQRMARWAEIEELDAAEVRRYVEHRLRVAGRKRGKIFANGAFPALAQASEGVPRNINAICFEALSSAFAEGKKRVGAADIRRAASGLARSGAWPAPPALQRQHAQPRLARWVAGAVLAGVAGGVLTGSVYFQRGQADASPPVLEPPPTAPVTAPTPEASPPLSEAAAPATEEGAAPLEPAPDELPRAERVRVRPSETMRRIALRTYGRWNSEVWEHIRTANPGLTDPGKLKAGQVLVLPSWETARRDSQR